MQLVLEMQETPVEREEKEMTSDFLEEQPIAVTCPDCGGALRRTELGTLTQFRCHIGHVDTAEVMLTAQFKAVNQLKRMDGGVFAATTESGEPLIDQSGEGIMGSSLESSNTDISDEFTKLIITQQAYSAGTKIISSANDMLQEALNMIR